MNSLPSKPAKTPVDYLVVALSPALVFGVVVSLSLLLVEVFYRGEMIGAIRWVVFWYSLAVVLVSRIGIEQGPGAATLYGLGLAGATWVYLLHTQKAYLLSAALLAVAWWSARRLTFNCTLVDEEAQDPGTGVLDQIRPGTAQPSAKVSKNKIASVAERPGVWVIYFSLAALPLFGLGQALIPANDTVSRKSAFILLVCYLTAALELLLTTSFLGLRRYLRQRFLQMPSTMAFAWLRSGMFLLGVAFLAGLLLPRPGADYSWRTVSAHVDRQLAKVSEVAADLGSSGEGPDGHAEHGAADHSSEEDGTAAQRKVDGERTAQPQSVEQPAESQASSQGAATESTNTTSGSARGILWLLRILLWACLICTTIWVAYRNRAALLTIVRSFLEMLRRWFSMDLPSRPKNTKSSERQRRRKIVYVSPFLSGKDQLWSAQELILYTYEAVRDWAANRGVAPTPHQTAAEFCAVVGDKFPEIETDLHRLASIYGHAAYHTRIPADFDKESLRRLWQYLA